MEISGEHQNSEDSNIVVLLSFGDLIIRTTNVVQ